MATSDWPDMFTGIDNRKLIDDMDFFEGDRISVGFDHTTVILRQGFYSLLDFGYHGHATPGLGHESPCPLEAKMQGLVHIKCSVDGLLLPLRRIPTSNQGKHRKDLRYVSWTRYVFGSVAKG